MIDRETVLVVGAVLLLLIANQVVAMTRTWIIRVWVHRAVQAVNGAAMVAIAWLPPRPGAHATTERIAQALLILLVVRRSITTARAHSRARRDRSGDVEVRYGDQFGGDDEGGGDAPATGGRDAPAPGGAAGRTSGE